MNDARNRRKLRHQAAQKASVPHAAPKGEPGAPRPLASLLQDPPATVEEVLPVFLRLLQRLSGIHKDQSLKPVLNPRLVWIAGEDVTIDTMPAAPLQATQALSGKYSSFEQLSEPPESLHKSASDVYVAGFVFYEILLGRTLFNRQFADLLQGNGEFKWLNWHCDLDKIAQPLEALLPGYPAALSQIVEGMMQKDIAKRPAVSKVVATFKAVLENAARDKIAQAPTVMIRRKRSTAPLKKFVKRVFGAALLLAAIAGILRFGPGLWQRLSLGVDSLSRKAPTAAAGPVPETSAAVLPETAAPPANARSASLPNEIDSGTGVMLLVPETEFEMGSDGGRFDGDNGYENETPRHKVRVAAFYIDRNEVTNRQYKEFADATGRSYPANPSWDDRYFDKPDHPVMNVSWSAARAYATWAGKELPTEAQWELAARGAEASRYPWGNQYAENAANLSGSSDGARYTAPVGSFKLDRSAFGIMDMAGNVSEWVNDLYELYPGNSGSLGADERTYRVVRGAGMTYGREFAALSRRMAHAPEIKPGQHTAIGFRCVSDAKTVREAFSKTRKQ